MTGLFQKGLKKLLDITGIFINHPSYNKDK